MTRCHFLPLAATAAAGTAALGYYAWDQAALRADRRREDEPVRPMSQLPEEAPGTAGAARRLVLSGSVQFVLRLGYPDQYPEPVSVRRPVEWFVRT